MLFSCRLIGRSISEIVDESEEFGIVRQHCDRVPQSWPRRPDSAVRLTLECQVSRLGQDLAHPVHDAGAIAWRPAASIGSGRGQIDPPPPCLNEVVIDIGVVRAAFFERRGYSIQGVDHRLCREHDHPVRIIQHGGLRIGGAGQCEQHYAYDRPVVLGRAFGDIGNRQSQRRVIARGDDDAVPDVDSEIESRAA